MSHLRARERRAPEHTFSTPVTLPRWHPRRTWALQPPFRLEAGTNAAPGTPTMDLARNLPRRLQSNLQSQRRDSNRQSRLRRHPPNHRWNVRSSTTRLPTFGDLPNFEDATPTGRSKLFAAPRAFLQMRRSNKTSLTS